MILTNCDYIEVEMYGKAPVRYYPDNRYIGLDHPPIEIEGRDRYLAGYPAGRPHCRLLQGVKPIVKEKFLKRLLFYRV